jgi:PKD repeat protein
VKRPFLLCCGVLAGWLLWPGTASAADFSVNPFVDQGGVVVVKTGNVLTFQATPGDPADSWDLNGDGLLGDQVGPVVQWTYGAPGPVAVTLSAPDGPTTKSIQVVGPSAAFVSFPTNPVTGQEVKFAYSSSEATDAIEWDLDTDGVYGDVKGPVATRTFTVPGTFPVSLRVSNIDSPPARSTSTQLITVAAAVPDVHLVTVPKPRLMSPFPVVRITGKVVKKGARIKRLTVRAPYGSTVAVRCRSRSCPFHRSNQTLKLTGSAKAPAKTIRVRKLEHRLLRDGASIKVLVSKTGEIGKYTRFRIRGGRPPVRSDRCLTPGSTVPKQCPSS